MTHFDIARWTDFVRGLLGPVNRAAMQAHLNSGCEQCRRTADLLQRFATVARAEKRYQVPEYAVRSVKTLFALQQPERVNPLSRIAARLVYDSARQPLPAGVRASHRISRQVLYQAGDYALDLRLEHERGSRHVNLVGQIANQKEPTKPMAGLLILALAGKRIVGRAVSNAFGEFQREYEPKSRLRLWVPVEGKKQIEVVLNGLATDRPSEKKLADRKSTEDKT